MGFAKNHTRAAIPASWAKHNKLKAFMIRASLVGNSFQCETVGWLLSHLFLELGWMLVIPAIASFASRRTDAARAQMLALERPITRGFDLAQLLVLSFIRGIDHRGSDVRLDSGVMMNPSSWPRQGIPAGLWKWKIVLAFKWQRQAHINELEVRAALSQMLWRLRNHRNIGTKFLHLLDSQVAIGVLCKRRSSSRVLQFVLRKVDALELCGSLVPVYGYCHTEDNPADAPSRWQWRDEANLS